LTEQLGYWLYLAFGAPSTSGSDPYTHVFTVGTTQPDFTYEVQNLRSTAAYSLFNGCKVSRLSMSVGADDEPTLNMSIIGQKETLGAASFDAANATPAASTRLTQVQNTLTIGGSGYSVISADIYVDFKVGLENYLVGTTGMVDSVNPNVLEAGGTIKALFDTDTLLDLATAETETTFSLVISAGASASLTIAFDEIVFQPSTPPVSGPGGLMYDLPFKAYYANDGDASVTKWTLVNTTETISL
jgi:hypothetical protein